MVGQNEARKYKTALVDVLLFLLLAAISFSAFKKFTHGDLWLDEADYAVASLHTVQDNRWDSTDKPDQPEQLIRLRHYHAPATALLLKFAHRFGADEESLRIPFVIAGALSVGFVYLCGAALYPSRREIGAACAIATIITPANARMASHAVPWSVIILELMALLLGCVQFARNRRATSLIWCGLALGALFVTSETFFVVVPILALALPVTLLPEIAQFLGRKGWMPAGLIPAEFPSLSSSSSAIHISRKELLKGIVCGAITFLVVGIIIWPAGLRGHCVLMLRHYIEMRHSESFPVNIGNQVYKTAPKWAYLYWYRNEYLPYFASYAAGLFAVVLGSLIQLKSLFRAPLVEAREGASGSIWSLPLGSVPLVLFTVVLLAAAHRAHIIGPEYLAHCLPFLMLCAGYIVLVISRASRPAGIAVLLICGLIFLRWTPSKALPGMDARTQISRWQPAAIAIKQKWIPLDRVILGPQSPNVAYWYLHEWAGIPMHDWQIGQFTLSGPGPNFLRNLTNGKYRFVVISSQFEDRVINATDRRSLAIFSHWDPPIFSDEHGTGPPRLTVFRCPYP